MKRVSADLEPAFSASMSNTKDKRKKKKEKKKEEKGVGPVFGLFYRKTSANQKGNNSDNGRNKLLPEEIWGSTKDHNKADAG